MEKGPSRYQPGSVPFLLVCSLLHHWLWNHGAGVEDDFVVVSADACRVDLFLEECHVVGEAEEVLLVFVVSGFARHRQLSGLILVSEGTVALDHEDVGSSDTVVEDDAPQDVELVSFLRQVLGRYVRRGGARYEPSGKKGRCRYYSGGHELKLTEHLHSSPSALPWVLGTGTTRHPLFVGRPLALIVVVEPPLETPRSVLREIVARLEDARPLGRLTVTSGHL